MISLPQGVGLVLASSSPRRVELLGLVGVTFEQRAADLDERPLDGETPTVYVERLARAKAETVARPHEIVVAADTTVDLDGEILAKPTDADDASRMLAALSGRAHQVHTGVAVRRLREQPAGMHRRLFTKSLVVTTTVRFVDLTADDIDWYVATGEPFDKAGGYAMQGRAAPFVTAVDGSVSNVIGLPLAETVALLRASVAAP